MAYLKISELTDATAVNDTDELPIVQAGTTKRITVAEFMAAAPQPTTTIIEDASVSKRVAGVTVAWVSGLTFRVSAGTYKIQGTTYTVAQTDVTLDAADATNPRIDIIAVNTSSAAVIIKGTAAVTPVKPDVDPDTQLELTFVNIAALATEPAFASSNVDIYHEGTEWTDSKSGTPITLDSTNNPLAGTKCIEATVAVTGNYIRLVAPSDIDLGDYDSLVFNIRSKGAWASTRSINIVASKTGVQRGSAIAFREGSFGFVSSNSTSYQQIVIPCSLFGAQGLSVDRFQLTVAGSGTGIDFYFDDMTLQGGTALVTDDTKMLWRGEWNSNTLYNLNDVVKLSNIVYVALRSNTNRTPATNTSDWQIVLAPPKIIQFSCSDLTTALAAGTSKAVFRMPHAMTVTAVRASLATTQTSGNIFTVDVNDGGTTILSTKLTIDNGEKTSTTAATAAVISDTALADDAEITVDIDQIGDGTAKGLVVTLIGY